MAWLTNFVPFIKFHKNILFTFNYTSFYTFLSIGTWYEASLKCNSNFWIANIYLYLNQSEGLQWRPGQRSQKYIYHTVIRKMKKLPLFWSLQNILIKLDLILCPPYSRVSVNGCSLSVKQSTFINVQTIYFFWWSDMELTKAKLIKYLIFTLVWFF